MAKLRKFCAYRRLERPYTRVSKFRNKAFVRNRPNSKVIRYTAGNQKKQFDYKLSLVSKDSMQIRHNAIESGRQSANKILDKQIGKMNYFLKLRIYPHHILRENPLASGAGADRMSTGMKKSFGKAVGVASQVKEDQVLMDLYVDKSQLKLARKALDRYNYKLPIKTAIVETKA